MEKLFFVSTAPDWSLENVSSQYKLIGSATLATRVEVWVKCHCYKHCKSFIATTSALFLPSAHCYISHSITSAIVADF